MFCHPAIVDAGSIPVMRLAPPSTSDIGRVIRAMVLHRSSSGREAGQRTGKFCERPQIRTLPGAERTSDLPHGEGGRPKLANPDQSFMFQSGTSIGPSRVQYKIVYVR